MTLRAVAALALALPLLSGCAPAASPSLSPTASWDTIAFETRSWGRIVSGWSIGSDGKGSWYVRENESGQPGPVGAYRVTYHQFDAGPGGFGELASRLAGLPDPAPVATDCENFRTDDLYGTLRQTSEATTHEIAWNRGCYDAEYEAFMAKLESADDLVAQWGRAAPVDRIERFDASGKGRSMQFIEPVVPAP